MSETGEADLGSWRGHVQARKINRRHPEGGISTELWMLSRTVGWWRLKTVRIHPDDLSKLDEDPLGRLDTGPSRMSGIRQIIDSPFLSQPVVVRAGVPEDEEVVDGQIQALLPDASQLRCARQSDE